MADHAVSSAERIVIEGSGLLPQDSDSSSEPSAKKRKINLENYFTYIKTTKKFKCQVKFCRSELRESKNPKQKSQLYRHLREVHKITEAVDDEKTSEALKLSAFFDKMQTTGSELTIEEKLLTFIVTINQPFSVVEQPSIRRLFPQETKWMSRKTIKRKILNKYDTKKLEIRNELQKTVGKISLIIDGWQSPNLFEFIGILASYIDREWRQRIVVLDFAVIDGRSNAKEIMKVVRRVLDDFSITERIHAITVDNASLMDALMNELRLNLAAREPAVAFDPQKQHIRCLNHVLNLSCQNALTVLKDVKPIEDELYAATTTTEDFDNDGDYEDEAVDQDDDDVSVSTEVDTDDEGSEIEDDANASNTSLSPYMKIKYLVTKVRKSSTYRGELSRISQIMNAKPLNLVQDVSVRWNSNYLMFERVLTMRPVIEGLVQKFSIFKRYTLSEAEWILIQEICRFLKPFYDYTMQLSREDHPSLSLAAATYMDLFQHLNDFRNTTVAAATNLLTKAIRRAEEKLLKYWAISGYLSYALGLVLDPRTKLKWYKDVALKDQVNIARPMIEEHWSSHYKSSTTETTGALDDSNVPSTSSGCSVLRKQMIVGKGSNTDELARYLKSATEPPEVDPLEWWKSRQSEFPNLSRMARDALGASATGTPIERKFSMGPLLITRLRSSLNPETTRAVLCLKAWLKDV